MQPIFKEYAHFLHDNGCDISWFQERTYWLDHNIVKAFTRGGQRLISLYKIAVSDDLTVALTKHKQNVDGLQFESWDETIARFRPHLESIERDSIALLRQYGIGTERKIVNTNSTGKDSMVVTHLAKKAGLNFETYLMLQPWMLRKVIVWQSETDSNTFCPIRSMVDFTSTSNAMMGGATK